MPSTRWIPLAAVIAALAAEAPAFAVINSPPAGGHEVTVFPERDFVALDPMEPDTDYLVEVVRNGVVIANAVSTTGPDGVGEINHPGGVCWAPVTPDILPGDVVRATEVASGGTVGDATTTSGVSATQAAVVGGQLIVHGTAVAPGGGQMPLGNLEQRIVEPALLPFVGKRDIRAPGGGQGFTSTLSYDTPGGTAWTATYTGLSGGAASTAAAGQTRILSWMATNPAGDRLGITIFEAGEVGGPGLGGCPAGARNAVVSPGVINASSIAAGAADFAFSGASQPDATQVDLAISDGTKTLNATGVPTAGAWTVMVPAADLATLADGPITVVGTYTVPGGTIAGVNLDAVKDTAIPAAPTASPGAGAYEGTQSIALHSADPAAQVRYTTNGAEPAATSALAAGQVLVSSSLTLKAVAIDPAGNRSAVTSLDYTITPKGPQTIVVPGPAGPTIIANTPSRARLSLSALTMRARQSRAGLRRSGLKLNTQLAKGTEVLRVRLYRGKKLLLTAYRFPGRSGRYPVSLKNRSVRNLKAGTYIVDITPGTSRRNLGAPLRKTFRVR